MEIDLTIDVCRGGLYTRDIHLANRIPTTTTLWNSNYYFSNLKEVEFVASLACWIRLKNFPKVTMLETNTGLRSFKVILG